MSRKLLRFFLSEADQDRIVGGSVVIDEVEVDSSATADLPAHHMLQIQFQIRDPEAGAPKILPMFEAALHFFPTASSGTVDPDPETVVDEDPAYDDWRTEGTLHIRSISKDAERLSTLTSTFELPPNNVWYAPVSIPKDFLFQTLVDGPPNGLKKVEVKFDSKVVKSTHATWLGYRVAGFLLGKSDPVVRFGASEGDDDAAKFPMPTVVMDAAGNVTLFVITAHRKKLQDSLDFNDGHMFQLGYDALYSVSSSLDPRNHLYPANGCVPAREVFRRLKDQFFDFSAGASLRDELILEWPSAPRYLPIRYTRTFKPVANASVWFFGASVNVSRVDTGAVLQTRRLPAHGLLFIRQDPAASGPQPDPPLVRLTLTTYRGGTHLARTTDTDWRTIGTRDPVDVQLSADWASAPHVLLRAPMKVEVMLDPFLEPGEDLCTYSSLRRSVRVLVNNRIAGGRLLFGPTGTSTETEALIREAFTGTAAFVSDVADDRPLVKPVGEAQMNDEASRILRVLKAFFNEDAGEGMLKGEVAYWIWQSNMPTQASHTTAFPAAHVGRGGPGALVFLGLSGGYHSNPDPTGDGSEAFLDAVVTTMLTGLEQGALLQYWWKFAADYQKVTNRQSPTSSAFQAGHSPMFLEYTSGGFLVIDQFAVGTSFSSCDVSGAAGSRLITWGGVERDIWLAANWIE